MKKTRKKKQVCGAACFMAAEIKFSEDVRLSRLPCPLCNIYSSRWILSILATNDHYHERVCRTQWPLTLTYIFKVIRPWLQNRVRSVAFTVLDGFFLCLAQMITIIRGCVACYFFFRIWKFEFLANFSNFSALTLKKNLQFSNGFFPYLIQMITSMRECVAYNDLWPWHVSSRSFDLDFENRVRSVASTVLNGFFPYLIQMITSMRECVAYNDLWPWHVSSRSIDLDFENRVRSVASTVLNGFFPYLI